MDFKKYERKLKYPNKGKFYIDKCVCGLSFFRGHKYKFCPDCGMNVEKLIKSETETYNELMKAYRQEQHDIREMFKKDVLEYVGLIDHKNADKIFEYAWRLSHSGGYNDILSTLEDLSELFE